MHPVYLFDFGSRQAEWASIRQATISGNIANANTPGYRAKDIEPFQDQLSRFSLALVGTNPAHQGTVYARPDPQDVREGDTWDITHSGNTVSIDEQLMRASETSRRYELNMTLMRTFHRMILTSVAPQ